MHSHRQTHVVSLKVTTVTSYKTHTHTSHQGENERVVNSGGFVTITYRHLYVRRLSCSVTLIRLFVCSESESMFIQREA